MFSYQIYPRETKTKGTVYDIFFEYKTEDGTKQKRISGFKTKREAKEAYENFLKNYSAPPKENTNSLPYKFAKNKYFEALKGNLKNSSIYDIESIFKVHVTPYFENKDLSKITKQEYYAWQDKLWAKTKSNGQPYSANRLKKIRAIFHAFIKWCVQRYEIKDFISDTDIPKRKDAKREYIIWTKDQFKTFYETLKKENHKAIFYTFFFSGIRMGELQALKPEDYDGKALRINKSYTRKTHNSKYEITTTKNYKERKVFLPEHACKILDEWISFKKRNRINNTYLFGSKNPVSERCIRNALKSYTAIANLPKIRVHDLRHSYVSMLLSSGANVAVIATLIGDTIEQVVKTYSHMINEDLINSVQKL